MTEAGSGYFSSSWSNARTGESRGSISVFTTPDYVRLYYISTNSLGEKHNIDYKIQVTWTPCNYGGERAWFICKCGRRVRKLFLGGVYFYCRHCQRLNYYSQQQSKSDRRIDCIRERIYKIQKRLKTEQDSNNTYYAQKPKGMHQKTYTRLIKKMRELGQLKDRVFVSESIRRFGMML